MGVEGDDTRLVGLGDVGEDDVDHLDEHSVFLRVSGVVDDGCRGLIKGKRGEEKGETYGRRWFASWPYRSTLDRDGERIRRRRRHRRGRQCQRRGRRTSQRRHRGRGPWLRV